MKGKILSSKKWILVSWLSALFVLITIMIFTIYLIKQGVPLRFSNSISYDAKLNYIHNHNLLNGADTIIIGSSMGLSDINGLALEKSKKINKVANISSWGMNTSEILELFKMIDLSSVKYVVYGAQYLDFCCDKKSIKINDREIKKFLKGDFLIKPYIKTANKIILNLEDYIKYDSKYMDHHKYQNLDFDSAGDALYASKNFNIEKERWNHFEFQASGLSNNSFEDLIKIVKICHSKHIKFFLVIPPIRKKVLISSETQKMIFKRFIAKISFLSKKYSFVYINLYNLFDLDDSYFVDAIHLNKKGATKVSEEILKKL